MRAASLWLLLPALAGCGVTTHVRPVPPRTLQVEGAVGLVVGVDYQLLGP